MVYNYSTGFFRRGGTIVFDTLAERIKFEAGGVHHWAHLSLRMAAVLAVGALVFAALYVFVQALD
jgi:hypothetical protein